MKLGVVMDPIGQINYQKDSTLAMLWEAKHRGYELFYFEQGDLFFQNGKAYGNARKLTVFEDPHSWFELAAQEKIALADLDIILMRKDPPFNEEYIYTTYILESAEQEGTFILNRPQALRDTNEKFFASFFEKCSPPHLITQSKEALKTFWHQYKDIVCKPLNVMGGQFIFRLKEEEYNANVIFEVLTQNETKFIMAQQYIPEITLGDKRILLINGEPVPYLLARMPKQGDWRGNLAAGAKGVVQPLSKSDYLIAEQIGPTLRERGLYFVGIDVIGNYLTEVNVTSPTCIREIEAASNVKITKTLFDFMEKNHKCSTI